MTWRANSTYAGRQGNRAGERYMRLRLFDRIRRLAHPRRSLAAKAPGVSGAQGRHRRGPATAPSFPGNRGAPDPARGQGPVPADRSAPGGLPAELAHTAAPWPGGSAIAEAPFTPGFPAGPGGPAGSRPDRRGPPGVRAGAARARIREAPPEAAPPVSAAPGLQARWQETAEPAPAQAAARAAELARVAAGIPRQPDGFGRSAWRPAVAVAHAGLPFAAAHARERPRAADGRRHCGS